MVSRWVLGCASLLLFATPAFAAPNWESVGGAIFAASSAPGVTQVEAEAAEPLSLAPVSRQPFAAEVEAAATRRRLDPKLLHALVTVESAYQPGAVSAAGAGGLTQLLPPTAEALGASDRFDVPANLAAGAAYLAKQLSRFGDLRLALAAYNAGPERVARLGRVPDFPETRTYVDAVIECYLALAAGKSIRTRQDCRRRAQ